jgi:aarF domain-containing kinase
LPLFHGCSSGGAHSTSSWLTEDNAERLANALCRMRGAALKLGQMLSIQDENVLPPQFQAALERVRAGADVMPRRQLQQVLVSELGEDWETKVAEFDWQPMAAASIGQVRTTEGRPIALQAGGSQLVVC